MKLTQEQLEKKEFTFCVAVYNFRKKTELFDGELTHKDFIVGTPYRKEAEVKAYEFATKTWGKPEMINFYPRNYIREARELNEQELVG